MKTLSIRGVVVCVVLMTVAVLLSTADRALATPVEKPGLSLAIPAGWREMPPDVLQTFYDTARKKAGGAAVPRYDYGFQLEASEYWLAYPYVLIRVDHSGRIPEPDLKAMPRIDLHGPSAQMRYDDAAHLVWMTLDADLPDLGKIRGLAGMIPTDDGWIHVNGYARAEDFERYADAFRGMARSVRVAPQFAYRPHLSDNAGPFRFIDTGNFWVQFLFVGTLIAIAGTVTVRTLVNRES